MKTAPTADNVSPSEEMVHPNSSTSPTHPAVAKGEAQKSVVERTNTSLPPPDATHRPPDVRVSSIGFQSATHSSGWIKTTPQPPAASTAALLLPIGKTINVSKNIAVPALARTIVKPTMAQPNQPDRTPLNTKATVLENPAEVVDEEIAPEAEYTAIMYERPNIIEDYYGIGRV